MQGLDSGVVTVPACKKLAMSWFRKFGCNSSRYSSAALVVRAVPAEARRKFRRSLGPEAVQAGIVPERKNGNPVLPGA